MSAELDALNEGSHILICPPGLTTTLRQRVSPEEAMQVPLGEVIWNVTFAVPVVDGVVVAVRRPSPLKATTD